MPNSHAPALPTQRRGDGRSLQGALRVPNVSQAQLALGAAEEQHVAVQEGQAAELLAAAGAWEREAGLRLREKQLYDFSTTTSSKPQSQ